jgi:hypothetical protein
LEHTKNNNIFSPKEKNKKREMKRNAFLKAKRRAFVKVLQEKILFAA